MIRNAGNSRGNTFGGTFSVGNPPANNGVCITAWQTTSVPVASGNTDSDAKCELGNDPFDAFRMEVQRRDVGQTLVEREIRGCIEADPAGPGTRTVSSIK